MSQSLADILLHIVFSTQNRQPLILPEIEQELYRYISAICRDKDCPIIEIGGMPDHIHCLLTLGRNIAISNLIQEIKSNSSRWIKTKGTEYRIFSWQNGYGIFSVSRRNMENVAKYISSQKEHHKIKSFKDEFLMMLKQTGIKFDEKFLWD